MSDSTFISGRPNSESGPAERHPSSALRMVATVLSYLFHPLFIPIYVVAFLLYLQPLVFAGFSMAEKKQTLLIIILNLVFFPLITVLLLKALGFIDSLYLRSQKDRIIPYIATGIFYFWAYTVFKQQPHYPLLLTSFVLGAFLAASAALIVNIYFKVSMHALGLGGWLGLFLIMTGSNSLLVIWPLAMLVLISGLVLTSRMILGSHGPKDIYAGLFGGIASQYIAHWFLL